MPDPLPRVCSFLAHQLRTPLSVLQGYIRLLQRQRDDHHPDAAMLEAMLEATGRLTVIARQASELGSWLSATADAPLPEVTLRDLFGALESRAAGHPAINTIAPPTDAGRGVLRADRERLADAVMAIAESLLRETGSAVIELSMSDPHAGGSGGLHLRPLAPVHAPAAPPSRPGAQRALLFDRGGAGLAMVAASYVLDAHRARVGPADDPHEILIQFPREGGAE